jgi:hypothetical protein
MKKFILFSLVSLFSVSPVYADEITDFYEEGTEEQVTTTDTEEEDTAETEVTTSTVKESEDFYDVKLIVGSQSGLDKYVPITVRITPHDTPSKTQITWEVPDDFNIRVKHSEFIEGLVKDQTYEYKVRVKAKEAGTYEISVNVTAWEPESNYTTSSSVLVSFDKDLIVDSSDSVYILTKVLQIVLILLAIAGAGFGIFLGWKKLSVFLKDYLKPPEI